MLRQRKEGEDNKKTSKVGTSESGEKDRVGVERVLISEPENFQGISFQTFGRGSNV